MCRVDPGAAGLSVQEPVGTVVGSQRLSLCGGGGLTCPPPLINAPPLQIRLSLSQGRGEVTWGATSGEGEHTGKAAGRRRSLVMQLDLFTLHLKFPSPSFL